MSSSVGEGLGYRLRAQCRRAFLFVPTAVRSLPGVDHGDEEAREHVDAPLLLGGIQCAKADGAVSGVQQCPSGTKKIYVYRDLNDALWSMFPFMTSFLGLVNQVTAEVYAQQRALCVFSPDMKTLAQIL